MRENQKKARRLFENHLEDKIRELWKPGCNYKSAAIVIIDFSVADSITLHVHEKGGGHKSDIITGSNKEFVRDLKMWGHLKVSEEYGITIRNFELIRDPNHSYTAYSSKHIESITFPVHIKKLDLIQWMYRESHPYIT